MEYLCSLFFCWWKPGPVLCWVNIDLIVRVLVGRNGAYICHCWLLSSSVLTSGTQLSTLFTFVTLLWPILSFILQYNNQGLHFRHHAEKEDIVLFNVKQEI